MSATEAPEDGMQEAPLVLVVDDARDGRESCAAYLSFCGYAVETAADGEEALRKADDLLPDIILMDLRLPKIDGLEATRRLKTGERTRQIPIIVVTAHALQEAHDAALAAGCDDVVTKPYEPSELAATIRQLLSDGDRPDRTENGS